MGYKVTLLLYRACLLKAPWFGVFLVMATRMDVPMCFRADFLLEIPRVHISK